MDEFNVRLAPTNPNRKNSIFKIHKDDNISWAEAKMRRENEYQPWQIKVGNGKTSRRFKAAKEGGVGDNASYFIFYKPNNKSDTYEVCPIDEWYSVSATQRYKTLTAEEAEQQFEQRHKILDMFKVMNIKKNGETGEDFGSGTDNNNDFKGFDRGDWDQSGDDEASDEDNDKEDSKMKVRRKKAAKKEKEDPDAAPEEGKEDSDEGDFEQREVDYMTDTSSDSDEEPEQVKDETDVKGIAEEEAMRGFLSTDDEEDDETNPQKLANKNKIKTALGSDEVQGENEGDSSDDSLDSVDYDVDEEKMDSMFDKKGPMPSAILKDIKQEDVPAPSTSKGVVSKRKVPDSQDQSMQAKRPCKIEPSCSSSNPTSTAINPTPSTSSSTTTGAGATNATEKIVEDLIVKYLTRKPMTLKNLLKEVKSKLKRLKNFPEMETEELIRTIATIIKRLSPLKSKVNDVTYLYLPKE